MTSASRFFEQIPIMIRLKNAGCSFKICLIEIWWLYFAVMGHFWTCACAATILNRCLALYVHKWNHALFLAFLLHMNQR